MRVREREKVLIWLSWLLFVAHARGLVRSLTRGYVCMIQGQASEFN